MLFEYYEYHPGGGLNDLKFATSDLFEVLRYIAKNSDGDEYGAYFDIYDKLDHASFYLSGSKLTGSYQEKMKYLQNLAWSPPGGKERFKMPQKSMVEFLYDLFQSSIDEEFWRESSGLPEAYGELNNGEQLTCDMKDTWQNYDKQGNVRELIVRLGGNEYRVSVEQL